MTYYMNLDGWINQLFEEKEISLMEAASNGRVVREETILI